MARGIHWRSKEDLILVETLTEFVAKGISIHEAFPTVAERLGGHRTAKACYARWANHLEKIYGKAIKQATQKQEENANKVVASILDKQAPLEVVHEGNSKVELMMPNAGDFGITPAMPAKIEGVHDVVSFLTTMNKRHDDLKEENNQLLEELERAWDELEKLKMEIINYKQLEEKLNKFKEIANKIESVMV